MMGAGGTAPDSGEEVPGGHVDAPSLRWFVMALFFIFGGITSLNDVLIPKLKELFTLNYAEALSVQTAFFAAYAIVGIPGAMIVKKVGYMRGAAIGLLTMMAGCLMFIPASSSATFPVFLAAMLVLGAGVTIVQVVANPLISLLGHPQTASSRLAFAQAFNSIGTTIFPYVGTIVMLGSLAKVDASKLTGEALTAYRVAETAAIEHSYLGLAAALLVIALVVWFNRNRLKGERHEGGSVLASFGLLARPRFGFGAACIFLYVGAEVAIGSLIVNYMMEGRVLGLSESAAGKLIPFYWGGALVGRLIGSALLRVVNPGKILAFNAVVAIVLLLVSTHTGGQVAAWSYLSIGLFNSIMFPTIFSLASEGLGKRAADGSGVICVMIVGGAVIPPLTGHLADITHSLALAMALPALCYALIGAYGWFARRPLVASA
nr:sugar MFS transporter [Novosphingobium sp. 9]